MPVTIAVIAKDRPCILGAWLPGESIDGSGDSASIIADVAPVDIAAYANGVPTMGETVGLIYTTPEGQYFQLLFRGPTGQGAPLVQYHGDIIKALRQGLAFIGVAEPWPFPFKLIFDGGKGRINSHSCYH